MDDMSVTTAIIQHAPCFLNREATLQLAAEKIEEAATAGARLVVFPEAFVPGYPAWVWRLRPGGDWNSSEALHQRLLENAVDVLVQNIAEAMLDKEAYEDVRMRSARALRNLGGSRIQQAKEMVDLMLDEDAALRMRKVAAEVVPDMPPERLKPFAAELKKGLEKDEEGAARMFEKCLDTTAFDYSSCLYAEFLLRRLQPCGQAPSEEAAESATQIRP